MLPAPRSLPRGVRAASLALLLVEPGPEARGTRTEAGPRGWHSLRRKFASDLMDQPLKVLCELGGWKNPQTVLICYQHANTGQLRKALDARRRVRT